MKLRTILFWTHLTAGLVAGIVILIMSVTGTLLTFQQSVLRIVERSQRFVEPRRRRAQARCRHAAGAGATGGPRCRADDRDARFRSARVGVRRARAARNGLRQSLHRRRARVGLGSGAGLLPIGHQLAPVSGGRGRAPRDGARDHRRVQRGVSRAGGDGPLSVVAAAVDVAARERGDALPTRTARQGPRLQLAQRDRVLVRADPRRADGERDGHLLHLGEQPGLHADREPETCRSRRTRRRSCAEKRVAGAADAAAVRRAAPAATTPGVPTPVAATRPAGNVPRAVRMPTPALAPTLDSLVARAEQQVPTWRTMIIRLPPRAGGPVAFSMSDRALLEQLRALDADARRTHRRRRPMGAVRGDEPRTESPRVAALRPHGRARRTAGRSRRRARIGRRRLSRLYRRRTRAATARRVAFAASRGIGAARNAGEPCGVRRRGGFYPCPCAVPLPRSSHRRRHHVRQPGAVCRRRRSVLAAVARSRGHRRLQAGEAAGRVERDEEHPLEEGDSRAAARARRSSGATCVFVSTAVPVGVERRRGARRARHGSRCCTSTSSWRSTARMAGSCGSGSRARTRRTKRAHQEWGTWASPSIVTDGTHVIASFESRGIYAFDMKGTPVWQKDLGDKTMRNQFGEGSSPALHGNTLVIVWDHQGGVVHRRARQAHGRGALAHGARRNRLVGDAARRRRPPDVRRS